MNHHHPRRTAIKYYLTVALLACLAIGNAAFAAQVAATVTRLSGPLLAKKANGTAKILSLKSEVEEGDTLVTEKNTYAQIKFIDNSEVTLKPGTTFKIENFAFDDGKPDGDSATLSLVKGGLRSVTGLLGKRNKEKFALKTPTATIGIRGTTFIADYVPPPEGTELAVLMQNWQLASTAALGDALPVKPLQLAQNTGTPGGTPPAGTSPGGLTPGLYVSVIDGAINLSNKGGSQNFTAGQFGYTASSNKAPVIVPSNPGLKFTPPATFAANNNSGNKSSTAAKAVDCEVR